MTDNQNLALWNKVSRVPKEHLKGFTRGGGFKGTAIKPMWSIHTMTEQFGPCGEGWGIGKPDFTVVPSENETPEDAPQRPVHPLTPINSNGLRRTTCQSNSMC